jgi:hypothetical protein
MDCAWPQGAGSDLIESRAVPTTAFSQISRIVRFRGKFAVTWHDGGKRHRHSLMTDNRAEADQRPARFVAAQAAARATGASKAFTVADAWEGYRQSLGAKPAANTMGFEWRPLGPTLRIETPRR